MGGFKFVLSKKGGFMRNIDVFGKTRTTRELAGCIFANALASPKICDICPAPSLCRETDESKNKFFNLSGNGTKKTGKPG